MVKLADNWAAVAKGKHSTAKQRERKCFMINVYDLIGLSANVAFYFQSVAKKRRFLSVDS